MEFITDWELTESEQAEILFLHVYFRYPETIDELVRTAGVRTAHFSSSRLRTLFLIVQQAYRYSLPMDEAGFLYAFELERLDPEEGREYWRNFEANDPGRLEERQVAQLLQRGLLYLLANGEVGELNGGAA